MFFEKRKEKSFVSVAMTFILIGAAMFAYGLVAWLINVINQNVCFVFPAIKVIGGLIIMALGYIQLEIELFRQK